MEVIAHTHEPLNFTHNWNNKLECISFTTIRLANPQKYQVGNIYEIILNKGDKQDYFGLAKLIEIKKIKLHQVNEFIAHLDTGYSADACKTIIQKMYQYKVYDIDNQIFYFMLFTKKFK